MSIKLINIEYRNLKQRESDINYRFEPPFVKTNEFQKRDLNYNDLKKDFIEELAAYGFSPYMHKTFAAQSKDKNIVKMTLSGKKLIINSYASEIGKVEETIDVECNVENDISISFSAKYMLEALKTFKDEKIMILLNGDIKPIVVKSTEDETLIQLILPIKTY